jgi:hypothetical protein
MFGKIKKLGDSERQAEFLRQEQIARLQRIMDKMMKVFEEERLTVPEGFDIVANLVNHFNRDVMRILGEADKLRNAYDQELKKNNSK